MNYLQSEEEIPNILWQTSKSSVITEQAKPLIKSWLDHNPNLEWYLMDDARCEQFIEDHFDQEFTKMYKSLPFGVMKADVWRVAILYVYGGIYADTDCHCLVPISTWIKSEDKLIVVVEVQNGALANFIFASIPKHPALLHVLNRFMELYKSDNFLINKETPIQNFGQYGFSDGILSYYKLNDSESMTKGGISNYYNDNEQVKKDKTKFILHQDNRITNGITRTSYVAHMVASLSWNNYASWRKQQRNKLSI